MLFKYGLQLQPTRRMNLYALYVSCFYKHPAVTLTYLDLQSFVFDRVSNRVCLRLQVPLVFPPASFPLVTHSLRILIVPSSDHVCWSGRFSQPPRPPVLRCLHKRLPAYPSARRILALSCGTAHLGPEFAFGTPGDGLRLSRLCLKFRPSLRILRLWAFGLLSADQLDEVVLQLGFVCSESKCSFSYCWVKLHRCWRCWLELLIEILKMIDYLSPHRQSICCTVYVYNKFFNFYCSTNASLDILLLYHYYYCCLL